MKLIGRNTKGIDMMPILRERMDRLTVRDTETDCWFWKGEITNMGYGRIRVKGKNIGAHRLAFELAKGKIPEGMLVLHSCDVRSCVNPDHLRVGTQKQNQEDARLRNRTCFGEKNNKSKLTEEDVVAIRKDSRTLKEIAKDYCVKSASTICYIKSKKTWARVL